MFSNKSYRLIYDRLSDQVEVITFCNNI